MNELPNGQMDVAKPRIRQVFEYLRALNDHRNPAVRQVREHPWHFWLDDLPDHPAVDLIAGRPRPASWENDDMERDIGNYVLRVSALR